MIRCNKDNLINAKMKIKFVFDDQPRIQQSARRAVFFTGVVRAWVTSVTTVSLIVSRLASIIYNIIYLNLF